MSSSKLLLVAAVSALAALSACTSGPLYGTTDVDPGTGARSSVLTELRGRIAVQGADTRTAQIFRNAMLFELNGAEPVRGALYELRYTVTSTDQVSSLETGTGVPTASLYRMTVGFDLVRLADNTSVAKGSRFAMIPYDRTNQVFAATRAVVDAQNQAGETVARRILFAIGPALQRDAMAGVPTPATAKP
ncbi:hypothetical protein [Aureimonas jatrophae]|uniref:LPS-assembly lipoprotein n=1 Tax=Aureimonas jatrophae TaxID=1166073 RepID=A0A1H0K774_9HYPH|nr:hypothetical protein [Aureimonas jatrophae]MBB3950983.1 LPS-assembly lipoprotein [Aureimonas jatrophae]SDO51815.1 LPS-assembly lipoprotein [Aureimonas jatrophae]